MNKNESSKMDKNGRKRSKSRENRRHHRVERSYDRGRRSRSRSRNRSIIVLKHDERRDKRTRRNR